jgi:hypothetical protein
MPTQEASLPRISVVPVLVGTVHLIVLTYVIGNGLFLVAGIYPRLVNPSAAELEAALLAAARGAPALMASHALLGACATVASGFVAGRLAKSNGAQNGAAATYLLTLVSAYGVLSDRSAVPMWLGLLSLPLFPILGAFGGAWGERRAREA